MIFVGYPGIGKSSISGVNNYIDLESSNFWIETDSKHRSRPNNWEVIYVNIAVHLSEQGYDVFLSSHDNVRKELNRRNIKFYAIFPSLKLYDSWHNKLMKRYDEDPSEKNLKALLNVEDSYDDNVRSLMQEKHTIIIDQWPYRLEDVITENI